MHFLVTGGAGFLGSALANRLREEGHRVSVLDDLSNGERDRLHPDIAFTQGDIDNIPLLWSLLHDVDCVYHLAARVIVAESVLYPREYSAVNVGGTVTLMEAMRDVGVRRVVFVSSGAVYGDRAEQPLKEDSPLDPHSPYAVSKLSAEYYVRTIGDLWAIETVSLRVFNAYGPGQNLPPSHAPVIPNFIRQAVGGGTLVVHSDGKQTRDYVYVEDVVNAMVAAATARNINRQVINVGSGEETSVRELTRLVLEATNSSAEVIYNPRTDPGVTRMRADLSLAKDVLSYRPRVSLEEGVRLTLEKDVRFRNDATRPIRR